MYALRSKYLLAYATYGFACGIKDPKMLGEYGKRKLLRLRRSRIPLVLQLQDETEPSSKRARLEDIDQQD